LGDSVIKGIRLLACVILVAVQLSAKPITVFAHGFNNHAGRFQKRHAIYAPQNTDPVTVTFKHRLVSFGVKGKKTIAETVGNKLNNPMSFVSFSQGTAATMHYLANKKDCSNIRSVLLIGPLANPADFIPNHSVFKYLFMPQWLGKQILSWKLPHYNPAIDPPIEQIENITNLPKTCPIIIMHGTNDHTSRWEQGYSLAKKFHELGYPVYFIEHEGGHNQPYDPKLKAKMKLEFKKDHTKEEIRAIKEKSCVKEREEFAKIIHAIYKKHGLPHQAQVVSNPEEYSFSSQQKSLEEKSWLRKTSNFFKRLCTTAVLLMTTYVAAKQLLPITFNLFSR
jgi:hypothetical protein